MGPPMLEKEVKKSQSRAAPPLFTQAGGRGMTLSFPYPRLSLRQVRDSEVGKFLDNIVFTDFPLIGAYL